MSVYPFCAQCKRKTPEKTVIFNSYCGCCNETLCHECSNNHTSVKGFSDHKLIDSAILLSTSTEFICHCNVHLGKILIWYCPLYDLYLCEECEKGARFYATKCNNHIHVLFAEIPDRRVLSDIKKRLEGEMSKMENILDICYRSRTTNEEELNIRTSDDFNSETTSIKDEKDRKAFKNCFEHFNLERKGIEMLQQYLRRCQVKLKSFFGISPAIGMLFLIIKISNLKQDILKLYSFFKTNKIQFEDQLKNNCTSNCEAGHLIIKSFRLESTICVRDEDVRKVVLIGNDVLVFTPCKIQRFNFTNKLEKEIQFCSIDSAYIQKLDLVAIMVDKNDHFAIDFLNIATMDFDKLSLKLPSKQFLNQRISAIAASPDYIYFAGENNTGRIALNGHYTFFAFDGGVGNEMIINNNDIIIPFGQYIRIFSLNFELLRVLTLSGETPAQMNKFEAQQPVPNEVGISSNLSIMPNLYQRQQAANFITTTTDQVNNVYAVNTNSQDITRWNLLNKTWEAIITPCHGSRCPSSLNFDENFSYAYVCAKDSYSSEKLFKYKVIWDII